ncbi:cupredoxin domain-containing protein [Ruegeria lacuscaerulensis]|uniref:cupredoxin domain-containing protein n=1 Tax=Ruegeria lacuscaerulensis TaxID=55218 RepID=UPI003AF5CB04
MSKPVSRRFVVIGAAASAASLVSRGSAENAPKTHEIQIRRFKFEPDQIQVRPGDRIKWVNLDIAPHTATAVDRSWDTFELVKDANSEIQVTEGMEQSYFCEFHPHMKGRLEIL